MPDNARKTDTFMMLPRFLKDTLRPALRPTQAWLEQRRIPQSVKIKCEEDRQRTRTDPGSDAVILACLNWLQTAQQHSISADDGVARDYSLIKGWNSSYPETTGYIIPTLLEQARRRNMPDLESKACKMLDWLLEIQFPEGGFQGGVIGQTPVVPVTFNTGQILMGLAAGATIDSKTYATAMRKAADWLTETQDKDGCWRKFRTPFATQDDKAYETHVAWGLIEAARLEPHEPWKHSALAQVDWALGRQTANGWIQDCCLSDPERPLTHTLGYVLRGIIEAWRFSQDERYLYAAERMAKPLAAAVETDGFLSGRFDADWRPSAEWVCLTGSAQIAHCWLMLFEDTNQNTYLTAAKKVLSFTRGRVAVSGPKETKGAVAGSWPIDGGYCTYEYPNWAAKFLIDACQLEQDITARAMLDLSINI